MVGGGIIGLAVARELSRSIDAVDVVVFEKESTVGLHQTGHNSGVVHAGLYYAPGSLKARLCRRGVLLLRDYVAQNDIGFSECGKLVVALTEEDVQRLDGIHSRAVANGVPGIRLLGAEEITEIEPNARGLCALYSPSTAIVDYPAVAQALAADVRIAGGSLRMDHDIVRVSRRRNEVTVSTAQATEAFDIVITCAGLQSDRLARSSGDDRSPRIVPFFGDYYLLNRRESGLVNGLIYPVPDPRYPFLGVHLTKQLDGRVTLGPNAFLSPGREAYRLGRISVPDVVDAVGFPGFWRFAARNAAAGIREVRTVFSTGAFVREAQKYVPAVCREDVERGPRGIRAQAMNADGSLVDDFVITGGGGIVHIRNAPSPGATSSLAIAEHIVHEVLPERLGI